MLDEVTHRTPWAEAALRTATGAVAAADGDHERAGAAVRGGRRDLRAASPTPPTGCWPWRWRPARCRRAGDEPAAEAALSEVRAFALRNDAPGLLRLAMPDAPRTGSGPSHAA